MLLEISGEITPQRMTGWSQSQKQYPAVGETGDRSKVQCCKEQYCIGTWNVRSMNPGKFSSVQFSSVQSLSCVQLFATPWTEVHQASLSFTISKFAQTHVHWVGDAIQPSHPLWSPSPPAFNLSEHQGLFQWISSSHQVAKVLELQLQHQSSQWIFRVDFL